MTTLLIALGSMILYLIAYNTYGKWLGQKIFKLDPNTKPPSIELEDGNDYVPTKKGIVFGHHFTSIAGTGPIVGPALAVIWGWVPALLWVLFGSIFIGAVHDFGALVVSMRNKGKTVGDIAGSVINPRVRFLFLLILFLALTIVLAIFGLVIASVFKQYEAAIIPCLIQIPLAIIIGLFVHRKGANILIPSLIALAIMYLSVAYGDVGVLHDWNHHMGEKWSPLTWCSLLLIYSYVASVLPVWTLLQPRDYINSLQLISALALVVIGLLVAGLWGGAPVDGVRPPLEIAAPAIEENVSLKQLPLIFPFLFITIACGAISGFHCLVSSGTSSKQLRCETDAQFVGYGSMLTEGFLAVLVILACVAGLGLGVHQENGTPLLGLDAWNSKYMTWSTSSGLGAKVGAFVEGSSNFLTAMGISSNFAKALMGVFVASFAATTLDTACRLQRYVVQELATCFDSKKESTASAPKNPLSILKNKHGATIFAIIVAFGMAALPGKPGAAYGTGGLILWPLFGAVNQLLGGLAFLVILFWMRNRGLSTWFVMIPAVFMLALPAWAMLYQIFVASIGSETSWIENGRWLLVSIGLTTIILEIWMIAEALMAWRKLTKQNEALIEGVTE
ncbi:carbon starvation protein [Rubritalea squalenifaciens DSM 18772]|uniref:Carbon starvation protein n=1 Tax=Rubritalea squalenifaciens DSM 18772 TaxID=1123071 RepID=A0A1M6MFU5_9BACT|nr:carbon starvation protein A [Rubritalea squalenifaciens]SHJ82200.1 carbon starvation protein [Rubritalea squalenifaciens DSM 18772]